MNGRKGSEMRKRQKDCLCVCVRTRVHERERICVCARVHTCERKEMIFENISME